MLLLSLAYVYLTHDSQVGRVSNAGSRMRTDWMTPPRSPPTPHNPAPPTTHQPTPKSNPLTHTSQGSTLAALQLWISHSSQKYCKPKNGKMLPLLFLIRSHVNQNVCNHPHPKVWADHVDRPLHLSR